MRYAGREFTSSLAVYPEAPVTTAVVMPLMVLIEFNSGNRGTQRREAVVHNNVSV